MDPIETALKASESQEPGEYVNYTQIAKHYGVNRATVSKRHRGVQQSKEPKIESQLLLSHIQSEQLIKWTNGLTERGLPPPQGMVSNFAKEISGTEPGKNWISRWVTAHKEELVSKYATGLDRQRKKADSAEKYEAYFKLLGRKMEEYQVEPRHTYNMDEKGYCSDWCPKGKESSPGRRMKMGE